MGTTAVQHPLRSHDPRRLGPYEVLARLGQGGMGVVYLGRDDSGQSVAIKTLRQELSLDEQLQARFRSEVNRVRQVQPFCTAPILVFDLDHDPQYLVVDYVDGWYGGKDITKAKKVTVPKSGSTTVNFTVK